MVFRSRLLFSAGLFSCPIFFGPFVFIKGHPSDFAHKVANNHLELRPPSSTWLENEKKARVVQWGIREGGRVRDRCTYVRARTVTVGRECPDAIRRNFRTLPKRKCWKIVQDEEIQLKM